MPKIIPSGYGFDFTDAHDGFGYLSDRHPYEAGTLALDIEGTPDPQGAGSNVAFTATVTAGGIVQTGLVLTIRTYTFNASIPPTDGALDGWTNTTGWDPWSNGIDSVSGYDAIFTKTSQGIGSSVLNFTQPTTVPMDISWNGSVISNQNGLGIDNELVTIT